VAKIYEGAGTKTTNCLTELRAIFNRYPRSEFHRAVKMLMRERLEKGDRERRKPISCRDKWKIFYKQFGKCPRCGDEKNFAEMTVDHIEPIVKGGLHAAGNFRLVCATCNSEKGDKDLLQDSKRTGNTVLSQLK